jgi:hypothetical protein
VALFVGRAFGFALDIETLMNWVKFTQGRFEFVDDQSRQRWAEFSDAGGEVLPRDVLKYLEQYGKGLEAWRVHLAAQL